MNDLNKKATVSPQPPLFMDKVETDHSHSRSPV